MAKVKREPNGPAVYLARGRSKHALYKSARGDFSPAMCGVSPHWADPYGWRGSTGEEEKAKLKTLPWCTRCGPAINHVPDLVAELPIALKIQLPPHNCPPAPVEM